MRCLAFSNRLGSSDGCMSGVAEPLPGAVRADDEDALRSVSLPAFAELSSLCRSALSEDEYESDEAMPTDGATGAAVPRAAHETSERRTATRHSSDCRFRWLSSDWPTPAETSGIRASSLSVGPGVGNGEDDAAEAVEMPGRSVVEGKWVVPSLATMLMRLWFERSFSSCGSDERRKETNRS